MKKTLLSFLLLVGFVGLQSAKAQLVPCCVGNNCTMKTPTDCANSGGTDMKAAMGYSACDGGICSLLSVELLTFEAKVNKTGMEITWATSTERNNSYFTLMKSLDGVKFFTIAKVKPQEDKLGRKDYKLEDKTVVSGKVWYKLLSTDANNNVSEYRTIIYKPGVETGMQAGIYPNPTTGKFTVKIGAIQDEKVEIFIRGTDGKVVVDRSFSTTETSQDVDFDLSLLPNGIYYLHVHTTTANVVRPIVVL